MAGTLSGARSSSSDEYGDDEAQVVLEAASDSEAAVEASVPEAAVEASVVEPLNEEILVPPEAIAPIPEEPTPPSPITLKKKMLTALHGLAALQGAHSKRAKNNWGRVRVHVYVCEPMHTSHVDV